MHLSPAEGRVVACLIEKQLTTPQQYPLTLNALVLACNQTSNRDPVVTFAEQEVQGALDRLREARLVRFVLPSHGRSVVRYRQVLDETLGLDPPQQALLAVLLLRGPQTAAELRARAGRMTEVGSVDHDLGLLADRSEPLVERQGRRPGEREERWTALLADPPGVPPPGAVAAPPPGAASGEPRAEVAGSGSAGPGGAGPGGVAVAGWAATVGGADLGAEVAALRAEVGVLRAEVGVLRDATAALREALADLRDSLGG